MTAPDTFAVSPGQLASTLAILGDTALHGVIHLDSAPEGAVTLTLPEWRISDGEYLLWRCLAWLSGHDDLPALPELEAGLDADNYAAVCRTLRTEGVAA